MLAGRLHHRAGAEPPARVPAGPTVRDRRPGLVVSTSVSIVSGDAGYGPMAIAIGRVAARSRPVSACYAATRSGPGSAAIPTCAPRVGSGSACRWRWPACSPGPLLNVDNCWSAACSARRARPLRARLQRLVVADRRGRHGDPGGRLAGVRPAVDSRPARRPIGAGPWSRPLVWAVAAAGGPGPRHLAAPAIRLLYGDRWLPAAAASRRAGACFGALRVVFDLWSPTSPRAARPAPCCWRPGHVARRPGARACIAGARLVRPGGRGLGVTLVAVTLVLPAYLVCLRRLGVPTRAAPAACLRRRRSWRLPAPRSLGLAWSACCRDNHRSLSSCSAGSAALLRRCTPAAVALGCAASAGRRRTPSDPGRSSTLNRTIVRRRKDAA